MYRAWWYHKTGGGSREKLVLGSVGRAGRSVCGWNGWDAGLSRPWLWPRMMGMFMS